MLANINKEHSEILAYEVPSVSGWRDVSIIKLEAKQAYRMVLLDMLTSRVQEVTSIMQIPHHFLVSFLGQGKKKCNVGREGDQK